MQATLLLAAALSFTAALLYVAVAVAIRQREARPAGVQRASGMFMLWWCGLAAVTALGGLNAVLVSLWEPPVSLVVGLQFLTLPAACMGLAGLLYYLLYLFTGRGGFFWLLVVGYALYCGFLIRSLAGWGPVGIEASFWEVSLVYAEPASPAVRASLFFLLLLPQLTAAVALLGFGFRLPRSASRVRVLVVASGVLAWFGSAVLASALGVDTEPAWEFVELVVPVAVAAAVLLVHRPPEWLQARMPAELATEAGRRGS